MRRGVRWDAVAAEEEALARALLERVHLRVHIKTTPPEQIAADYDPRLTEALEGWTTLEISIERQASTRRLRVDLPKYRLDMGRADPREIDPAAIATALGETWPTDVPPPDGPPPIYVGTERTGPGCGDWRRPALLLRLLACATLGDSRKHYRRHPDQTETRSYAERLSDARDEQAPRTLDVLHELRHNDAYFDDVRPWRETRTVTYATEELRRANATIDVHIRSARGNRNRWIRATFAIPGSRLAEGETVSGPLTDFEASVSAELRRPEPPEPEHFR